MGNSNGRTGRFCDHDATNRQKVTVLSFHDSAPIQVELNYTEDKVYLRLKRVGARYLGIFLGGRKKAY